MTFLATPPFQSSQPEDDPEVESESPFIEERPPSSPPSQPAKGPVPLVEIVWTPRGHMTIKIPIDIVDKISRLFSQQGGGASTPVPATAAVRKHLKEYLETNPTANLDFSFLALQNPTSITSRTTEENHGSSCKKSVVVDIDASYHFHIGFPRWYEDIWHHFVGATFTYFDEVVDVEEIYMRGSRDHGDIWSDLNALYGASCWA